MGVSDPKGKNVLRDPKIACDMLNGGLCKGVPYFKWENMERLPETSEIVYMDEEGCDMLETFLGFHILNDEARKKYRTQEGGYNVIKNGDAEKVELIQTDLKLRREMLEKYQISL